VSVWKAKGREEDKYDLGKVWFTVFSHLSKRPSCIWWHDTSVLPSVDFRFLWLTSLAWSITTWIQLERREAISHL
jgi:hypothetical protein